ncbi:MAG: GNAT family N-acetyltransferase [Gemmatimonadaceae bacterium]
MPVRDIRYQAAVVREQHLLVVQVRLTDGTTFWLLPGGGREASDESAEACVSREVHEETGLHVTAERLLSDVAAHPDDTTYERWRTYLCRVRAGEARPGAADGAARLAAVAWLPLSDEASWPPAIRSDRFLYPQLVRIATALRDEAATDDAYELRVPRSDDEWAAYHTIRRTVLFERRGRFGVYDAAHPDEHQPGHYPFLLFHDREPVGTIRIDVADDEAIFRRVAVHQDLQRQGHGRKMLELAETFVRTQSRSRIRSHVDPDAVGFYERCGFRRERIDDDGATVLMRKDLPLEAS